MFKGLNEPSIHQSTFKRKPYIIFQRRPQSLVLTSQEGAFLSFSLHLVSCQSYFIVPLFFCITLQETEALMSRGCNSLTTFNYVFILSYTYCILFLNAEKLEKCACNS